MSGEILLRIQPTELKFTYELNRHSTCTIQMSNDREDYVAFKVKTTNPKKYSVRPNIGVVLPGTTCNVLVTMQAYKEAPLDAQCKDKFLVQSVVASHGATTKDITVEMFNKEPNKVVDEFKLRVVHVPASRPSPVPEESEEGSSPRSNLVENGVQNSSSVTESDDKLVKEKSSMTYALISKLTEEKASAVQQNQKLRQDLEVLRRESGKHQAGFSLTFVALVALLSFFIGFLLKRT
ncbi:Vesicle-associated protein 1-3 [Platanthera zijinensis]|uniref:Vesicle-associated protein 1-3 n=1 Tax=Platanthera zijinensis TaxID=2320716 RepID=A0AAP0B9W9_9ASPA